MLYIKSVQCKVFRLYSSGLKLPEGVRARSPAVGRLIYAARLKHEEISLTVFTAQLLAPDSDNCIIPVLVDADTDLTMCRNSNDKNRSRAELGYMAISGLLTWPPNSRHAGQNRCGANNLELSHLSLRVLGLKALRLMRERLSLQPCDQSQS
jgi:hypothetical protein